MEATLDYGIKQLRDQIIEIIRSGHAVKIEGLGTWSPNIGLDGTFDIQYRADTALTNGLNIPGIFSGTIRNRDHIGKSIDELVAAWNMENSNDQVED